MTEIEELKKKVQALERELRFANKKLAVKMVHVLDKRKPERPPARLYVVGMEQHHDGMLLTLSYIKP